MITLHNTFHRTFVNTRLKEGKNIVSATTMRRWDRTLCDNPKCSCRALNECRLDGQLVEYEEEKNSYYSSTGYRSRDGWIVTITVHGEIDPLNE